MDLFLEVPHSCTKVYTVLFTVKNETDKDVIFQVKVGNPLKFSVEPCSNGVLSSHSAKTLILRTFPEVSYLAPPLDQTYYLWILSRSKNPTSPDEDSEIFDEKSWDSTKIFIACIFKEPYFCKDGGHFYRANAGGGKKPIPEFKILNHEAEVSSGSPPEKKIHSPEALPEPLEDVSGNMFGEVDIQKFLSADIEAYEKKIVSKVRKGEAFSGLVSEIKSEDRKSELIDVIGRAAICSAKLGFDPNRILSSVAFRMLKRDKLEENEQEGELITEVTRILEEEMRKTEIYLSQDAQVQVDQEGADLQRKFIDAKEKLERLNFYEKGDRWRMVTSDIICEADEALKEYIRKLVTLPFVTLLFEHERMKMITDGHFWCKSEGRDPVKNLREVLTDTTVHYKAISGVFREDELKIDQGKRDCLKVVSFFLRKQLENQVHYFTKKLVNPSPSVSRGLLFKIRKFFGWWKFELDLIIKDVFTQRISQGDKIVKRSKRKSTPVDYLYRYSADHQEKKVAAVQDDFVFVGNVIQFIDQQLEEQRQFVSNYGKLLAVCRLQTEVNEFFCNQNKHVRCFLKQIKEEYCVPYEMNKPDDSYCEENWLNVEPADVCCNFKMILEVRRHLHELADESEPALVLMGRLHDAGCCAILACRFQW